VCRRLRERSNVPINGRVLELTPKEFDFLAALARDPGAAVSRRHLLQNVWETSWYGSAKTIDVHVAARRGRFLGLRRPRACASHALIGSRPPAPRRARGEAAYAGRLFYGGFTSRVLPI
jgi:hypothetical protein